jgi:hypothetical protein
MLKSDEGVGVSAVGRRVVVRGVAAPALLLAAALFAPGVGRAMQQQGLPPEQYATEYLRTKPDLVVYRPEGEFVQGENQHFIVSALASGRLLGFWTQSTRENHADQKIVMSASDDGGKSWSAPVKIDGAAPGDPHGTGLASWSFPIVTPKTGRVWIFYNKNVGIQDTREDTTGVLRGRYSADEGRTWSETFDLPIAPCALSHPDPKVPQSWIVYQAPVLTPDGVPIAGFTHWGSAGRFGKIGLFEMDSEIRFLRFENILTETDPKRLEVTTWPKADHGLRVPRKDKPAVSVVQEPSVVALPDGRLFCVMRTLNGYAAWSQSRDGGRTWADPEPLRFHEGGPVVPQPIAPCPIYPLRDGRYLFLFHNNDGTANGGRGPSDYTKNRWPAFISIARFAAGEGQPLRFANPAELMTSSGVVLGPSRRTEVATYPSFTDYRGRYILWYPDRKHFLLGRYIQPPTP